ncbi:cytochrome P450 family protein [Streptomyces sp. YGL11-2]|uniref:cytochrome P450 family protein n=1 Tax=Streptomyces sp. YGL11-2 TaxID=3414028 RepID=UPI003CE76F76
MTIEAALPQPFNSAHFVDPHRAYARLREEGPVHQVALPDGTPIWLVLREADVRAWLTDDRLSVNKAKSGNGYKGFSLPPALDANLLNIDPADHLRLRRLVSKTFTPRRVEALRDGVQAAADGLADVLARCMETNGAADLVSQFANPLPLVVIGDLLGVPEQDRKPFSDWVTTMFDPQGREDMANAVDSIHHYLVELIEQRRHEPDDRLLSALIAVRDEGDTLTEDELVSLAFLILFAGSESTQHVISGGLLTLLEHPRQLGALREYPALLPDAVEEILRYAHPNQMAIRRFPTEDIVIGGTRIPAGDTVMLCPASAHRDPQRYPEPDRFDIHRTDKSHLALGYGVHYCLGAPLARLEIQTALGTLLRRFPKLSLGVPADQLRWRPSFRSHVVKELPITAG